MITQSEKRTLEPSRVSPEADSRVTAQNETDYLADRISQRVFEINKARGVKPWPEIRDWLQAEREIRAEEGQSGKLK